MLCTSNQNVEYNSRCAVLLGVVTVNMSFSVKISHGPEKYAISIEDTETATVETLKGIMHERTGIPPEAQKLIFRGTTLQNDEQLLTNVGLKEGSKLMLLGKKVDPSHDEHVKFLDTINTSVETVKHKLFKINQELEGIEKGFLLEGLIPEACEKLKKQCLSCNENLMQILEKLDSVVPLASDALIRGKRKTIVVHVQTLMNRTDELSLRIKTCSDKIHSTHSQSKKN